MDQHKEFRNKFGTPPKGSTDEHYTPKIIYDAVLKWVLNEYPAIQGKRIVRPFYPGGDYQSEDYTDAVVIDNPPFSILAKIRAYYLEKGVPYFLFAPRTVNMPADGRCSDAILLMGTHISYEGGLYLDTRFITNLEPADVRYMVGVIYGDVSQETITHTFGDPERGYGDGGNDIVVIDDLQTGKNTFGICCVATAEASLSMAYCYTNCFHAPGHLYVYRSHWGALIPAGEE